MAYAVRWRLGYADGRTLDEKPEGNSILERRPYPRVLQLIDATGQPVQQVQIPPGYQPIFYRQRSFAMDATGQIRLDATIFGYGREGLDNVDGKLWLWQSGAARDCPPEHLAPGVLEWLITASPETTRLV